MGYLTLSAFPPLYPAGLPWLLAKDKDAFSPEVARGVREAANCKSEDLRLIV